MTPKKLTPLVTTKDLDALRTFYAPEYFKRLVMVDPMRLAETAQGVVVRDAEERTQPLPVTWQLR